MLGSDIVGKSRKVRARIGELSTPPVAGSVTTLGSRSRGNLKKRFKNFVVDRCPSNLTVGDSVVHTQVMSDDSGLSISDVSSGEIEVGGGGSGTVE